MRTALSSWLDCSSRLSNCTNIMVTPIAQSVDLDRAYTATVWPHYAKRSFG